MIPWLLVAEMICNFQQPLSSMIEGRVDAFPSGGEINFKVKDVTTIIAHIKLKHSETVLKIDFTDGLSMAFEEWRFNLRTSNTEPVLRLNIESKGDAKLMNEMTALINC